MTPETTIENAPRESYKLGQECSKNELERLFLALEHVHHKHPTDWKQLKSKDEQAERVCVLLRWHDQLLREKRRDVVLEANKDVLAKPILTTEDWGLAQEVSMGLQSMKYRVEVVVTQLPTTDSRPARLQLTVNPDLSFMDVYKNAEPEKIALEIAHVRTLCETYASGFVSAREMLSKTKRSQQRDLIEEIMVTMFRGPFRRGSWG
jgi:hypothetical protein